MDQANAQALWQRAIDFHGHTCPGIAIGYRAAVYAMELLELEFSDNVKAQQLQADGSYQPVQNGNPPTDSQIDLYKLAYLRAQRAAQEAAQRPVAVSRRRGGRPGLLRRLGRLLGR